MTFGPIMFVPLYECSRNLLKDRKLCATRHWIFYHMRISDFLRKNILLYCYVYRNVNLNENSNEGLSKSKNTKQHINTYCIINYISSNSLVEFNITHTIYSSILAFWYWCNKKHIFSTQYSRIWINKLAIINGNGISWK